MAVRKRTAIKRERDLVQVAELHFQGLSQQEIAKKIGVCQQQVSYDLAELQKRSRKEAGDVYEEHKAIYLAKIDQMEFDARAAYERSCQPRKRVAKKKDKGSICSHVEEVEERDGDPRFLERISWCYEQNAKILGLYAPVKSSLTDPQGKKDYFGLMLEDFAKIHGDVTQQDNGSAAGSVGGEG